ncbi:Lipid A 3-O-deacylase (PagL) [Nitrosomonas sp. Nm51]|uniref:acyloxyacyl hydrolase n=1 Tax=Nitrosomonas sp. Nm51 TaxID=133720 RepID=UPI0008AD128F|nr:acyloxyacyl hydrolase [Nitrosomonas sp. Nm51]SER45847.1 Lipid A 3-O-deacylase (PagL) [Nitrosomonas sp. Nm51]
MSVSSVRQILIVLCLTVFLMQASLAGENGKLPGAGLIHQLKFGVLAHDVGDLWSGFHRENGVDLNIEVVLAPSMDVLGGTLRPALGGSINTNGDTSKGYLDILWQYNFSSGIFVVTGVGAAVHDGKLHASHVDRKALGSRVLFHIPLEIGYFLTPRTTFSVYFDHISNAYTARENEGMDTLGARLGYIF